MKKLSMKAFVGIAMLSSIAFLLMLANFPVLPSFSFLKVDFSDIPALIAALLFGPLGAILVELIKNILDYLTVGSESGIPIGHISNLIAGLLFVLPTYFVYNRMKTKIGMTLALIAGTISMSILMSILNYFIFLPAYAVLTGYAVDDIKQYIVMGILPFNILKGVLVAIIFMFVFIRLQRWILKNSIINNN